MPSQPQLFGNASAFEEALYLDKNRRSSHQWSWPTSSTLGMNLRNSIKARARCAPAPDHIDYLQSYIPDRVRARPVGSTQANLRPCGDGRPVGAWEVRIGIKAAPSFVNERRQRNGGNPRLGLVALGRPLHQRQK